MFTLRRHHMYILYTACMQCIHCLCAVYIQFPHIDTQYSYNARPMQCYTMYTPVYTQSVHSMYTLYTLRVHNIEIMYT